MKKIFLALVALALFTGCDDGDMTFKTFNFSAGSAPAFCTDNRGTIYQINGTEVLLLKLDTNLLLNVPSPMVNGVVQPTQVTVSPGSTNKMYYRTYSSTPNANTFCSSSGTPNLVEEWPGSGTLLITTTEKRENGVLTGYIRDITIKSATFSNGEQEVTIVDNFVGSFTENLNYSFNFPAENVSLCSNTLAYKTNGLQSLQLHLEDDAYLSGSTQLADIELNDELLDQEDDNDLYFRKFNTAVTSNNICTDDTPSGTVQTQLWRAIAGTVKIIPTPDSEDSTRNNYEIRLYNVVFSNNAAPTERYSPENTTGFDYYLMGTLNN